MATAADETVERASDRLHELAQAAADRGGLAARLAEPLEEDARFLRKMKPSLVAARIRGEAPTGGRPEPVEAPRPRRRPGRSGGGGGPSPLAEIGAAAGAGLLLAKAIDWRGHAHPRD